MKKIFSTCLVLCVILLTGCKPETITTIYSIGCLDFNVSANSDVNGFTEYMKSVVNYNNTLQFNSSSIEENDVQARDYFNEQVAKINADTACSYLYGSEFIEYGIKRSDDETTKIIGKITFSGNGVVK